MGFLQTLVNFIRLRRHEGAQYEIRLYADALDKLARPVAPSPSQPSWLDIVTR